MVSSKPFYKLQKRGAKYFKCKVSLDFDNLTRRGLLEECIHLRVSGESWMAERVDGARPEDRSH